jgi:hypothetical protein
MGQIPYNSRGNMSIDELNEYSKSEAIPVLQREIDTKDLDVVFTSTQYFKLKSNCKPPLF